MMRTTQRRSDEEEEEEGLTLIHFVHKYGLMYEYAGSFWRTKELIPLNGPTVT